MLQCLSFRTASSSLPTSSFPGDHRSSLPPPSQGPSIDGTPPSSGLPSPINLLQEYRLSIFTNSYNEVWTQIRVVGSDTAAAPESVHHGESIEETRDRILSQVLQPNKDSIQAALGRARQRKLTRLASAYFEESENTTGLFVHLQDGIRRARAAYTPLLDFLSVLPDEPASLTPSQCRAAHEIFSAFDSQGDPFPCPTLDGFSQMRRRFTDLKRYLDNRVKKSRSRAELVKHVSSGPAICIIGTAAAAAVAAAAIVAHSLLAAAVVITPCAASYVTTPRTFAKRELERAARLAEATRNAYALDRHLETIERLVEKAQTRIEGDRALIRMGVVREGDPYQIQQVVKHLRSNPSNLLEELEHLEEDICLCFTSVNKARRLLLEQVCPHVAGAAD